VAFYQRESLITCFTEVDTRLVLPYLESVRIHAQNGATQQAPPAPPVGASNPAPLQVALPPPTYSVARDSLASALPPSPSAASITVGAGDQAKTFAILGLSLYL